MFNEMDRKWIALAVLIIAGCFAFDLATPLGVASGVPYVMLVLLGVGRAWRPHVLFLAWVGTLLTLAGYFLSPIGGVAWVVFTNRVLAVLVIWVTALVLQSLARSIKERDILTLAIEQSPAGVVITDTEGTIQYINPQISKVSGYTRDELIGHNPRIFKSGLTPDETYTGMWAAITSGQFWQDEIINRNKTGSLYWEHESISPVYDFQGQLTHFVAVKEDVTERKRAEFLLKEAKHQAEVSSQAKSAFLANMSHELRTPLNAIIGFSETIQLEIFGPVDCPKHKEYLYYINDSAKHLLGLINQVLDLSKVEAGKMERNDNTLDLKALSDSCQMYLETRAHDVQVGLFSHYPSEPVYLLGDERLIKQALLNVLANAVKFTKSGGSVTTTIYKDVKDSIIIEVTDTGVGMEPRDIPKALSVFGKLRNEYDGNVEGTGLGLPLSKKFIELHGGEMEMESQLGKGTTVRFVFPLACTVKLQKGDLGSAEVVA